MAYGSPSVATGPFGAVGVIANVESRTKNKKAGGTYQVNIATLDNGVEVDFGFKPVEGKAGDSVSWATMKEYGAYKFKGADPAAGALPSAFPARPKVAPAAAATLPGAPTPAPVSYSGKPFPLPKSHGDTAIIRQNALTNSVATHGHLAVPCDDVDALSDSIIKLAYKYASFSSGNLDELLAADLAEKTAEKSPVAGISKAARGA